MKKNYGLYVVLIIFICIVFIWLDKVWFEGIMNSNMPDWLKWMFLRS